MTDKSESTAYTAGAEKIAGENQKKPRKKKETPPFDLELIDQMLGAHPTQDDAERVFKQLKKAVVERILSAELGWDRLRDQARPIFAHLPIHVAELRGVAPQ